MIKRSAAATLLAVGSVAVLGSYSWPQSHELEYVNSVLWTRAFEAEVRDGYLYVSFLNGLGILDVTDESNPQMVSKV